MEAACSDEDFIARFKSSGAIGVSDAFGVSLKNVFARRRRLEDRLGVAIQSPFDSTGRPRIYEQSNYPQRQHIDIQNGIVIAFSDAHYWPGVVSTAHRAIVQACKWFGSEVKLVVANGDILDGSTISRHPPIGWEGRPSLKQELETSQERLGEIENAAPHAERVWNLGNHDARFETRLATVAPEFANIHGIHLKDHFTAWEPAWSTWVSDTLVIKHRFKGGMHAPQNNTLWSGKSMATGHLHSAKVQPITDYNGTRWGVDLGCTADPDGPQFINYTEDNPKNWRQSFGVFTLHKGRLLTPELVTVIAPGLVDFRGRVWEV